jgi:cytochrome c oxidase assembly protein subunit 15
MVVASSEAGGAHRPGAQASQAVRIWLYVLAALVVVMVGIGGATRLTGSGLSITEWKPVTGAVPPLSDARWQVEFDKYRASSQYQNLNRGMELPEFKTIYWWEWGHRQLGRAIGLVFFVPLIVFWWRGALSRRMALGLLGIGALGGLQATVGWIMVASGLQPGMVAVAPIKLMLHLLLASLILVSLVWVAAGLRARREEPQSAQAYVPALVFLGLVLVQIALGGLVAGSRAGLTYNTWPLMDGRLIPPAEALLSARPTIENFVGNPLTVQFQHRIFAYLVVAFALWHAWSLRRAAPGSAASRSATGLGAMTLAQMALGIVTLLLVVPLWAGLAHQLFAMAILIMATVHARLSQPARAVRPMAVPVPVPAGALR